MNGIGESAVSVRLSARSAVLQSGKRILSVISLLIVARNVCFGMGLAVLLA